MTTRGEFKSPGGKLIAVELDASEGTLRRVVVTGDFFLYPEEALPALAAALEGSPANLDEAAYAAQVRQALVGGVELLGTSPEALAAAVVRALRDASGSDEEDDG
jgi:lipoate-protein ligase A